MRNLPSSPSVISSVPFNGNGRANGVNGKNGHHAGLLDPAIHFRARKLVVRAPELFKRRDAEPVRQFLRGAFSLAEVESVRIHPAKKLFELTLAIGIPRAEVARRLAVRLRSPLIEPENLPILIPPLDRLQDPFSLYRSGRGLSAWQISYAIPGVLRCRHPILSSSVRSALFCEQALQLLDGVQSVRVERARGLITVRYDSKITRRSEIAAALDTAISGVHPESEMLAPSLRGYLLDTAQLAFALTGLFAFTPAFSVSAILLVLANKRHLINAARKLKDQKICAESVLAVIVILTILNGVYVYAAIMALTVRSWKSIEHREIMRVFSKLRARQQAQALAGRGNLLVRGIFEAAPTPDRGVRVADLAAGPTLMAGVLGLATGGVGTALAAIRVDYLSAPRISTRMTALDFVFRCAEHDIFVLQMAELERMVHARHWIFDASFLEGFPEDDISACFTRLRSRGNRIGIFATENRDCIGRIGVAPDFFHGPLDPDGFAWHLTKLQKFEGPVVYVGRPLPWDNRKSPAIICIESSEPESIPTGSADAEAVLGWNVDLGAIQWIDHQIRKNVRQRRAYDSVIVGTNAVCSLGAVAFGLGMPAVVIATNVATGAVYLSSKSQLVRHHLTRLPFLGKPELLTHPHGSAIITPV